MKKLAVFCFLIAIVIPNVIAQNNPLYDVNYDPPKKIANYDNAFDEFQKIYLQYETAIKTNKLNLQVKYESKVIQKYVESYNADLAKIKNGLIEEVSDYTKELGKKVEELREMYGL